MQERQTSSIMDNFELIHGTNAKKTRLKDEPRFAEGLYDLKNGAYAWMVPNGSWSEANAGLIVGDGESLLIDTGFDLKTTQQMLDAMEPLINKNPIKYLVNTHDDPDHFYGNELIKGAEIICAKASLAKMKSMEPGQMLFLHEVGKMARPVGVFGADKFGHFICEWLEPYDFNNINIALPTRTFEGSLTLDVGGHRVELIEIASAHSAADVMVYLPEVKVLYASDLAFIDVTPNVWAGPVQNWISALDQIMDMDVEAIVGGHGPITGKNGIQLVKEYWIYITEELNNRFEKGMHPEEAATDLALSPSFAKTPYYDWDRPDSLMFNSHIMHKHYRKDTSEIDIDYILDLFRKAAVLATKLPHASPKILHQY